MSRIAEAPLRASSPRTQTIPASEAEDKLPLVSRSFCSFLIRLEFKPSIEGLIIIEAFNRCPPTNTAVGPWACANETVSRSFHQSISDQVNSLTYKLAALWFVSLNAVMLLLLPPLPPLAAAAAAVSSLRSAATLPAHTRIYKSL